jgi:hypothetical protein
MRDNEHDCGGYGNECYSAECGGEWDAARLCGVRGVRGRELREDLIPICGAACGIFRQAAHDQRCDVAGYFGICCGERRGRFAQMRRDESLGGGVCCEWMRAGEQLVRDDSPRVDVGALGR